jgi:hypothetical protein
VGGITAVSGDDPRGLRNVVFVRPVLRAQMSARTIRKTAAHNADVSGNARSRPWKNVGETLSKARDWAGAS